jgi:hypothetical protein
MTLLFTIAAPAAPTLSGLDWLTLALYFGILLAVAWWVIGASIFAS